MRYRRLLFLVLAILTISVTLFFVLIHKSNHNQSHAEYPLVPAAAPPPVVPAVAVSPMEAWLGHWEFTECWPMLYGGGANCVQYEMYISKDGDKTIADIDAEGFQTDSHIRGTVKLTKKGIKIVYVRVREAGLFDDAYKAGDVLFELSSQNGKVLTAWRKMEPDLDKNKKEGVHFEKVK